MRSIIFTIAIMLLLSAGVFAQSAANIDYAGKWRLDASKSKGLPPYYANIQSHRLDVKQTRNAVTVDVQITFNNGGEPFRTTLNYPLDGTVTRTTMPIRTPEGPKEVPTTLSGTLTDDHKLKLNVANEFEVNGKPFKGVTTETWQLIDEGSSLLIHLTRDTPQGKVEYEMFFVKQ